MPRYFSRRAATAWIEDETYSPDPGPLPCLNVPDHEATDPGLLDMDGNPIMRAPRPIGFGRMEDW